MLSSRKVSVTKFFLDKRKGGEYQYFPSKFFGPKVAKLFVEEQFYVSKKLGIETF